MILAISILKPISAIPVEGMRFRRACSSLFSVSSLEDNDLNSFYGRGSKELVGISISTSGSIRFLTD